MLTDAISAKVPSLPESPGVYLWKDAEGVVSVTYAGHPVYYFSGDQAAGDVNGKGSDGFGAKWYPVAADGAAIEH